MMQMKVVFSLWLTAALLLSGAASGADANTDTKVVKSVEQQFKVLLSPLVTNQLIPGYYLAVYQDDRLVIELSEGLASEADGLLPSANTLYAIMSMTKPIVSLATLKLVDQGKLKLTDPVKKFIPEFAKLLVVEDGDLDSPAEELKRDITIHDLLTHTSGLTYSEDITGQEEIAEVYADLEILPLDGLANTKIGGLKEHIAQLVQLPLVSQPGEKFIYSVSLDVLGRVLELVTMKPLDQVLKDEIFSPLGMHDTLFRIPADKINRLASMYEPRVATYPIPGIYKRFQQYKALPKNQRNFGLSDQTYLSGGAGLISTANDYAKFLSLLDNDFRVGSDGVFISQDLGQKMFINQLPEALGDEGLTYNFGPASKPEGFSYGLGIRVKPGGDIKDPLTYDYYHWAGAANTGFWLDRNNSIYGVFMTQHIPIQYNQVPELVKISRGLAP